MTWDFSKFEPEIEFSFKELGNALCWIGDYEADQKLNNSCYAESDEESRTNHYFAVEELFGCNKTHKDYLFRNFGMTL
jgi:hypothetical protein